MSPRKTQTPQERRIISASQLSAPVQLTSEQLTSRRCSFETPSSIFGDEYYEGELLALPSPWVVLRTPSGALGVIASPIGDVDDGLQWAVALVHDDEQCDVYVDWEGLPEVTLGAVSRDGLGWRGENWRLDPHPIARAPARSWVWPWLPGSYGVQLNIHLDLLAADLHSLLAECEPSPYHREGNSYVLEENNRREVVIDVQDGLLSISRSYIDHQLHQVAFDAGLCRRLAELSPQYLAWDLLDTEYLHYMAGGEHPGSLLDLVDPETPQEGLREGYRERCRTVNVSATTATDIPALAQSLAQALHLQSSDTPEAFLAELPLTPRAALPGHVRVTVNTDLFGTDECSVFFARCREGQPRVLWCPGVMSRGLSTQ